MHSVHKSDANVGLFDHDPREVHCLYRTVDNYDYEPSSSSSHALEQITLSHPLITQLVHQISTVVEKDIFISVWYAFQYYFITSTLSSIPLCATIIDKFLDNVFKNILSH